MRRDCSPCSLIRCLLLYEVKHMRKHRDIDLLPAFESVSSETCSFDLSF